jgi:RNA polymerase sigma-70 factor (ECF subfamily)
MSGGSGGGDGHIPEEYWALVEQYRPELLIQAQAILGNREDAEDVVQETFCDAVRDPAKLSNARSLGAWLKAINRCNALNRARGRRHDSSRLITVKNMEPERTFTTGGFNMLELRESVNIALNTLPPELQQIVRLRYFEHLSYKDIAERLQIPIGNVGGLLMDASMKLYAKLKLQLPTSTTPHPADGRDDIPTQQVKGVTP